MKLTKLNLQKIFPLLPQFMCSIKVKASKLLNVFMYSESQRSFSCILGKDLQNI